MSGTTQPAVPRPSHLHISNITILSLEVHTNTRGDLLPNPAFDAVEAIAAVVDVTFLEVQTRRYHLLVVDAAPSTTTHMSLHGHVYEAEYLASEAALIERLVACVQQWDPDFLVGFEIQQASYGYLIDRAAALDSPVVHANGLSVYSGRRST